MQITQDSLGNKQKQYIGMKAVYTLLMLGDQNSTRLITVLIPNNCQAVWSDVRPYIDKDNERLWENLRNWLLQDKIKTPQLWTFFRRTSIRRYALYEKMSNSILSYLKHMLWLHYLLLINHFFVSNHTGCFVPFIQMLSPVKTCSIVSNYKN